MTASSAAEGSVARTRAVWKTEEPLGVALGAAELEVVDEDVSFCVDVLTVEEDVVTLEEDVVVTLEEDVVTWVELDGLEVLVVLVVTGLLLDDVVAGFELVVTVLFVVERLELVVDVPTAGGAARWGGATASAVTVDTKAPSKCRPKRTAGKIRLLETILDYKDEAGKGRQRGKN